MQRDKHQSITRQLTETRQAYEWLIKKRELFQQTIYGLERQLVKTNRQLNEMNKCFKYKIRVPPCSI